MRRRTQPTNDWLALCVNCEDVERRNILELAPDQAEPTLEEIASGPESLEEFSARMVLQEWRGGRLQFP